ncbi:hypothetical protein ACDQ55_10400 [Chitinophaga sp. 30R24]|uniref:hypothetical protein n=1 Tax=Chitinophaga sp. 30R24 TaxID=3248838 RepID=UPI003B91DF4D
MQHFRIGLAIAIAVLSACNSGKSPANGNAADAATTVTPATPAGTVSVTIAGKEKDTQRITIQVQMKELKKEKTFEQTTLKEVSDADLYKVLWDAPTSCYIGVLKANHQPRYYHASVNGNDLKILWAASPPERIWQYMENTMGLGKVSANDGMLQEYKKNFQSGQIIADFIVTIKPDSQPDDVVLYVEYGGARKTMTIPVPAGSKAVIQPTGQDDHVFFSFIKDDKAEPVIDLLVENGRLQVKTLKEIK